jgi:spore coat polysaccharide biosynthesis predicted glycosyltransferase SpsG
MHEAPPELAPLMAAADLAVCAGGQTTYELAAMGLPAVALCIADNQRINLDALAQVPTLLLSDAAALSSTVRALAADRTQQQRLSQRGRALVDGRGADRVAAALGEVLDG